MILKTAHSLTFPESDTLTVCEHTDGSVSILEVESGTIITIQGRKHITVLRHVANLLEKNNESVQAG